LADIVVLGVFAADLTFRADRLPVMGETLKGNSFSLGPGGKGSNQAVACGKLGASVALITRLGDDDFARIAYETWAAAGVRPIVSSAPGTSTGTAFIFVNDVSGENAIIITPGAANDLCAEDVDASAQDICSAKVFITQLEQPLAAAQRGLEIARKAGVTTILNPAPGTSLPDAILGLCDIVTPNETEAKELTGISVVDDNSVVAACEALKARGITTPIITLGERGAYIDGHGIIPAQSFGPVVDTTGAGDAFNAGLATALSEGRPVAEAARFACAVAGLAVTRAGAAAAMPTRCELKAEFSRPLGQIMP
jgi:ribokinase